MDRNRKMKWWMWLLCAIGICVVILRINELMDKPTYQQATHIVQSNETLWDLGTKYAANGTDINKWIYEVKKINGMDSSDIYQGEEIVILTEEK